ncbi:MAG TPA: 6-carboxytetrahydropterin synthase [Candidatus Hydrogenedentes bacterium]|nr:6-carboxytetrahydropterin synthase [Candidatus Hydrogenedentota bacterium]
MNVELTKSFFAEAAHHNPRGNEKTSRLHGHSFDITLVVEGEVLSEPAWLIDYGDITAAFNPLYEQIDHAVLNEIEDLADPTVHGLRDWLFRKLKPALPCLKDVRVRIVGACSFAPERVPPRPEEGLPAAIRFTFEAAQSLAQLPETHKCHNMHGHSYRVEVAADDLEAVNEPLREIYAILDHRCLNDIPGLESATCEIICYWLWERLKMHRAGVRAVGVQETNFARCLYYGK